MEAKWEYVYNARHFSEAVEGHSGNFFYYFDILRICYGEAIYIPVIWFIYRTVKLKDRNGIAVTALFLGTYLFYSIAATKMPAYTLIACPAVFIITATAYQEFMASLKWPLFFKIVAISLILLPVRYAIERIKPFDGGQNTPEWNNKIIELSKSSQNQDKTVVFNCPYYIELMFQTKMISYRQKPEQDVIAALKQHGYKVIILP